MTGTEKSAVANAECESKRSAVVLLRWILIIATASVILFGRASADRLLCQIAVLVLILSNTLVALIPVRFFGRTWFDSLIVIGDIVLITGALWCSGSANGDFYLLYFVIIMIAALGDSLRSILASALLVSTVYLGITATLQGFRAVLDTSVLMRIPFFFIVSLFYGYFAQLVRSERSVRVVYETKLTLAKRLRELGNGIGSLLDRQAILQRLVDAQLEFTGTRYCAILSRGMRTVLAESGDSTVRPRDEEIQFVCLSLDRRILSRERGKDQRSESAPADPLVSFRRLSDGVGSVEYFREGEYTCLPISATLDADLYILLHGHVSGETLEYVGVILMSASMALNNAAQYQALVHEVEKRQEVNRQLTEMVEFKSQFVANISHEIRTPIHSFIGFGELLLNDGYGSLAEEQRVVLQRMVKNATNLLELVNNMLDFSKIEAGAMSVRRAQGSVDEAVTEIYEACLPLLSDKSVVLRIDRQEDVPWVFLDWQMFRQICVNLVSNAIKFTNRGRIDIISRYNRDRELLTITVRDTGIGIDPERFQEIFQPFRQLENSYTKRYAGTGLGLAISKRQTELLGGTITVRSKVGSWSEFTLEVPASPYQPGEGTFGTVAGEPRHPALPSLP